MGTDERRQRYELLREREQAGTLTDEARAELTALIQELRDDQAAPVAAANERKAQEIAAMAAEVQRLEAQNRQLREYLRERQAFLRGTKCRSSL